MVDYTEQQILRKIDDDALANARAAAKTQGEKELAEHEKQQATLTGEGGPEVKPETGVDETQATE